MASFGHHKLVFVTGEAQGRSHVGVCQRPVAEEIVQIVFAVLQINLQRLRRGFGFANQAGIRPTAADVCEAADVAQHLTELVRFLPSRGECANAAGRNAAHGPLLRIARHVQTLQRDGKKLPREKPHVTISQRIIFKRTIAPILRTGLRRRNRARIDEHGNCHRHRLLMNQVVEHGRHPKRAVELGVAAAVHKHHQARRLVGRILRGHIDAVVALRAGKDFALGKHAGGNLPLRHARLHLSIRVDRPRRIDGAKRHFDELLSDD